MNKWGWRYQVDDIRNVHGSTQEKTQRHMETMISYLLVAEIGRRVESLSGRL